jgi:cytochrome c biogenesis protein CcdA
MLGTILALASDSSTAWQGALLLAVYSFGLALPFLLVGVGFDRVLEASRWLRDHYGAVRIAGGAVLVTVGLLLFFDRFWWLNSGVSRVRDTLGLG